MTLSVALAAGSLALFAACQGSPPGANGTSALVAQRATDPRTSDPTAATAPRSPISSSNAGAPNPIGSALASASAAPSSAKSTTATTRDPAAPPKQISARHILIQWIGAQKAGPSVLRSREQALTVAEEVLKKAKSGSDVGRLAVDYSDEPNAGLRGGSLGRFGHGAMVPAFEKAAFDLEVGEISEIVETPFGFHIIQRTE